MVYVRFKNHFPFAAAVLIGTLLTVGDGTLAILALAGSIMALPLAYAPDVDEIARATCERNRKESAAVTRLE